MGRLVQHLEPICSHTPTRKMTKCNTAVLHCTAQFWNIMMSMQLQHSSRRGNYCYSFMTLLSLHWFKSDNVSSTLLPKNPCVRSLPSACPASHVTLKEKHSMIAPAPHSQVRQKLPEQRTLLVPAACEALPAVKPVWVRWRGVA